MSFGVGGVGTRAPDREVECRRLTGMRRYHRPRYSDDQPAARWVTVSPTSTARPLGRTLIDPRPKAAGSGSNLT